MGINSDVYDVLRSGTAGLSDMHKELAELKDKEQSGIYSDKMLNEEIRPKMRELKENIAKDAERVLSEARELVEEHKRKLREADALNGADITADAALFTAGVTLTEKDIMAILERNKDNSTMQQLAIRYAAENKIDIGDVTYVGHTKEMQEADGINTAISYYAGWIDKDNALDMLDKFFSVTEE